MQEANKFKLGLFVLISIIVLIVAIAFMGLFDDFQPKAHVVTFVNESIQGLNIGSAVKYKGVRIGNVEEIFIITSVISNERFIRIDINIDFRKFKKKIGSTDYAEQTFDIDQLYKFLRNEVKNGLRCRIEPDGITGIKYIEMDFFKDPEKYVSSPREALIKNKIIYIPATPSMLANMKMNVTDILASIAAVDFKGISAELKTLLETSNTTLKNAQLDKLVTQANSAADKLNITVGNINNAFTQQKMEKIANGLDHTIESFKKLSAEINAVLQKAQIPETTSSIRELSTSLKNNSASFQKSLQKVNDAVDALTELIIYLSDNPTSLLQGRGRENEEPLLK